MITGGTGSFGNAVLERFLKTGIGEIRIFSRDEKKQDDMRHAFQAAMPEAADKLRFFIGDVRDLSSIRNAMYGVDYIFHAAALKQVPSCEFFPLEAVKTNVIGTDNVLTAAIDAEVKSIICLSTDKAAYPVNAMGTSKAMMEKVIVAKSRTVSPERTKICCTRYGNVLCSRGSVVPLWIDQIKAGKPLTITEPEMTRFVMSLEEAVDLVLFAFEHGESGDILVQKAPACTIAVLAQAVRELFCPEAETRVIGIRHGEKLYETLLTNEECAHALDLGGFYRVPCDKRDLNYDKYFTQGDQTRNTLTEFNSNNTELLNVEQVKEKLLALSYIRQELAEWEKQGKLLAVVTQNIDGLHQAQYRSPRLGGAKPDGDPESGAGRQGPDAGPSHGAGAFGVYPPVSRGNPGGILRRSRFRFPLGGGEPAGDGGGVPHRQPGPDGPDSLCSGESGQSLSGAVDFFRSGSPG